MNAPIVLFVYNRPEHTLKTLNALKKNTLASGSELFVFSDGPKDNTSEDDVEKIRSVREIIHSDKWCGSVTYYESDANKGLYRSIREGVTKVIEECGKVIVMEDDIVTSPCFLGYMNKALDFYSERKTVFSISGFNYPASKMKIPSDYGYDTYVCLRNASWGWATWKDRWAQIDWEVNCFQKIKGTPAMKYALNRMGDDEFEMLRMRMEGKLNIWSIQFTMAHFINHAVAIYPTKSYVNNIGNDGTGENCGNTQAYENTILSDIDNPRFLDVLYEDDRIINAFYNIFCRKKRPLWKKVINRLFRMVGKKSPFVLKGTVYS